MRILAYCCKSFERTTVRATGVEPWTCPPLTFDQIDPRDMAGYDVLYLDLHGNEGDEMWKGDDGEIALIAEQIAQIDLSKTVVFALNCWLGNEHSPMLRALLQAGAKCVVGGDGKNWSSPQNGPMMYGAALLGWWFISLLKVGNDPTKALQLAKRVTKASLEAAKATRVILAGFREWLLPEYLDKVACDIVKASKDTLGFCMFAGKDMV